MRTENVYFPKWIAWFFIVVFIPLLIILEYEAFYGNKAYPIIGFVLGFVFIMVIVMMFMISYRRIPYMVIERQTKKRGAKDD